MLFEWRRIPENQLADDHGSVNGAIDAAQLTFRNQARAIHHITQ
jgi:hypothetical protein